MSEGEGGAGQAEAQAARAHLQAAQRAQAQVIAGLLREAAAEVGGRALHGAGDLRVAWVSGLRPFPDLPPPRRPFPPLLTALKPGGGGAEANDQTRPTSGATSAPGSILPGSSKES